VTPAELSQLITSAARFVLDEHDLDSSVVPDAAVVERPRNPEHGDYATNIAMQVAKKAGTNPREFGTWLAAHLADQEGIDEATVAGPGFINIRLAAAAQGKIVADILDAGAGFGKGNAYEGTKINLEFVSANPTGPIHLGGTRWAAVGDSLGDCSPLKGERSPASTTSTITVRRSIALRIRCSQPLATNPRRRTVTADNTFTTSQPR